MSTDTSAQFIEPTSWDLLAGPVYVDIASLANEEHQAAFRVVFIRLLRENRAVLAQFELWAIEAQAPINAEHSVLEQLPVDWSAVEAQPSPVADALYTSYVDVVTLKLRQGALQAELRVYFDNPEFTFNSLASHPLHPKTTFVRKLLTRLRLNRATPNPSLNRPRHRRTFSCEFARFCVSAPRRLALR
jgi:hypothetical protein